METGRLGFVEIPGEPDDSGNTRPVSRETYEQFDPATGIISWSNGTPTSTSGAYTTDFLNSGQKMFNSTQPMGVMGTINVGTAQSDPRGAMAQVVRGMTDDFFETAVPLKDQLMQMTTYNGSQGILGKLQTENMKSSDAAYQSQLGLATRNNTRMGAPQSARQLEEQDNIMALGKEASKTDAFNRAGVYQKDLNRELMSGANTPVGITK